MQFVFLKTLKLKLGIKTLLNVNKLVQLRYSLLVPLICGPKAYTNHTPLRHLINCSQFQLPKIGEFFC